MVKPKVRHCYIAMTLLAISFMTFQAVPAYCGKVLCLESLEEHRDDFDSQLLIVDPPYHDTPFVFQDGVLRYSPAILSMPPDELEKRHIPLSNSLPRADLEELAGDTDPDAAYIFLTHTIVFAGVGRVLERYQFHVSPEALLLRAPPPARIEAHDHFSISAEGVHSKVLTPPLEAGGELILDVMDMSQSLFDIRLWSGDVELSPNEEEGGVDLRVGEETFSIPAGDEKRLPAKSMSLSCFLSLPSGERVSLGTITFSTTITLKNHGLVEAAPMERREERAAP